MKIGENRTSVALEGEFWAALEGMALERGWTLPRLFHTIACQSPGVPLASALRVFALAQEQRRRVGGARV
jgi:predicted DNA-binding ribbon-helix-helix protein